MKPQISIANPSDMAQITPLLWVGGWSAAREHGSAFDLIVNCAIDAPHYGGVRIPLVDGPGNSREDMQEAVRAVADGLASGAEVLVHCVAGRSRSVAVAAAALARVYGRELDWWLTTIKMVRGCEGPNQPHPALLELLRQP